MLKYSCDFDFSDVQSAFKKFNRRVRQQVVAIGDEAVDYAVENGNYNDVTGNLRRSNRSSVNEHNDLCVYNEADYAAEVEAKGKDVISNAAIFAEKRLKEVFR